MQYFILDSDLNIVDGIELFQSMIWTEKFWDIGDFELYIPATPETLQLYSEAANNRYYIVRAADAVTADNLRHLPAMVIEAVKLDDGYRSADGIIITGRQLKSILSYRVITSHKEISGSVQDELYSVVNKNTIETDPDRVIPKLTLNSKSSQLDGIYGNYAMEGLNLATALTTVCKDKKLGWDVYIDFIDRKLVFSLLYGTDRSGSQEGDISTWNPKVVFSPDYDNLVKTTYKLDTEDYKNVAIVGTEYNKYNEEENIIEQTPLSIEVSPYKLDHRPSGLTRSELYVTKNDNTGKDKVTNIANLRSLMEAEGRTELERYKSKISIDGEIAHDITYLFGRDYFLGDLVTIQNEYGQFYDGRVTSVTINRSVTKNNIVPNFTIENYTGKEPEDKEIVPESEHRMTEDGQYRVAENGSQRWVVTGYIYRDRLTEDGQSRSDEKDQTRSVTKGVNFDDEKYGADVIRQ